MTYIFSDIESLESQTLFIIGNGFDLFHNIPSRYWNFYLWLGAYGKNEFIDRMETFFPEKRDKEALLWMDFERALGAYDIDGIFRYTTKDIDIERDENTISVAEERTKQTIMQIEPLLKQWVKSIDLSSIKQLLSLPPESKYLTFNYTMTLEEVYKIPTQNICHIHNCVKDDTIIVGHRHMENPDQVLDASYVNYYEEGSKRKLIELMNGLSKNTFLKKKQAYAFFEGIKNFKRIVVLGHSLSEIDEDYFGYVRKLVAKDAHWHFSKYSPSDEAQISKCIKDIQIPEENRWIFNL
ncbi:MAG: bacteriophage abortive infection AbiH family protein [Prevotella sp.]|nr:bacteriophage abortive infection AbiH family protein [Prevotella sp.]